jgi:hypothetical protein
MKDCENVESRGVTGAMKSTQNLLMNIATKGKTKKAFVGFE